MKPSLQAAPAPEVAFLGNGQALSLSGLQVPNSRVLRLLQDGDLLKKLFLFFDGLMVFGLGPASESERGVSLQPQRPLHELPDGNQLMAEMDLPVDEIAIQLIEMGLLSCVDPRSLIPDADVEKLLEALIDIACRPDQSRTAGREMVPFDPGALGVMMSDDLVRWVVDELRGAGWAEIHERKDLITFEGAANPGFSIGAELVFADQSLSEAFAVVSDQVVRAVAWENKMVCSPLRAASSAMGGASWRLADLAVLESEIAGVDLSKVSLADVIGFTRENDRLRRSYVRALRQRAAYLEQLEPQEAAVAARELQQEITDAGMDFAGHVRDYFGPGPVGVTLGIAGSIGALLAGNFEGAILALAQSLNSARFGDSGPGIYSYLFQARQRHL